MKSVNILRKRLAEPHPYYYFVNGGVQKSIIWAATIYMTQCMVGDGGAIK